MSNANQVAYGLEGVIALETELSLVDGANASLYYRGYHIDDLVEHATYEAVVYLLFYGDLPSDEQLAEFRQNLAAEQEVPQPVIELLKSLPKYSVAHGDVKDGPLRFVALRPRSRGQLPGGQLPQGHPADGAIARLGRCHRAHHAGEGADSAAA